MTPDEFKAARLAAGLPTQQAAADALESDIRTVKRWEYGERPIPGPVRVALRLMRRLPDACRHPPPKSAPQSSA